MTFTKKNKMVKYEEQNRNNIKELNKRIGNWIPFSKNNCE